MILSALRQHETYMRSLRPGKVLAGEGKVFSVVFDTGQDQTFSKISKRATGFVRHHQLTRVRGITGKAWEFGIWVLFFHFDMNIIFHPRQKRKDRVDTLEKMWIPLNKPTKKMLAKRSDQRRHRYTRCLFRKSYASILEPSKDVELGHVIIACLAASPLC